MKKFLLFALLLTAAQAQAAPPPTQAQVPPPAVSVPATPAPDTVVATVGGRSLTYAQFQRYYVQSLARVLNAQGLPYSPEVAAQFSAMQPSLLPSFARQQALLELVGQAGVKPETADAQLDALREQFPKEEDLREALRGAGFDSLDEYRQVSEQQGQLGRYLTQLQARFTFNNAVLNNFYVTHKASFTRPATACARHILLSSEVEVQDVASKLRAGADFAKLAAERSKDPGSASKGGDLGCFEQGQMVPEFDKASFTGPLNTLQTVKTQFGYHVLEVSKRQAAGTLPFSEAAPLICQQLGAEAAQKYLDSQLQRIPVKLYPERLGVAAPDKQS